MTSASQTKTTDRKINVMGTDWPIFHSLYKSGPRNWTVATICNGLALSHTDHATKAAAQVRFDSLDGTVDE